MVDFKDIEFRPLTADTVLPPFRCVDDDLNNFLVEDDFIKRTYATGNRAGCRFITVDAYANATKFYQKNGFDFFTMTDVLDSTRLMYFDLKPFRDAHEMLK
jgi:hypothetical protein